MEKDHKIQPIQLSGEGDLKAHRIRMVRNIRLERSRRQKNKHHIPFNTVSFFLSWYTGSIFESSSSCFCRPYSIMSLVASIVLQSLKIRRNSNDSTNAHIFVIITDPYLPNLMGSPIFALCSFQGPSRLGDTMSMRFQNSR